MRSRFALRFWKTLDGQTPPLRGAYEEQIRASILENLLPAIEERPFKIKTVCGYKS